MTLAPLVALVGLAVCHGFVNVPLSRVRSVFCLREGRFYGKSQPTWRTPSIPTSGSDEVPTAIKIGRTDDLSSAEINRGEPEEEIALEPGIISVSPKGTARIVKILASTMEESPIAKLMSRRESMEGMSSHGDVSKSVMLFLPGLDGVGSYSENTLRSLLSDYDVYKMECESNDRSTFLELADFVAENIKTLLQEHPGASEVVLAGESFGGLLASYVSARMKCPEMKLLLINPATSYAQTPWDQVGPLLTNSPEALFPFLGVGVLMALAVEPSQIMEIGQQIVGRINSTEDALREIQTLADSAAAIVDILPQGTLDWRLTEWLSKGTFLLEDRYDDVTSPTLLLIGRNDRLLPSSLEGTRLKSLLTGVRGAAGRSGPEVMEVVSGGHALLDGSLDIGEILRKSDTFQSATAPLSSSTTGQTRLDAPVIPANTAPSFLDKDLSVPYPTAEDIADVEERFGGLIKLVSPVLLSLDPRGKNEKLEKKYGIKSGSIQRGLRHVPVSNTEGRPVLFVGNHQLYGADLSILVKSFLDEKQQLIRGLAHPLLFSQAPASDGPDGPASSAAASEFIDEIVIAGPVEPVVVKVTQEQQGVSQRGRKRGSSTQNRDLSALFKKFGAVEVRADNMYSLLAAGETVLLFPGGVKEAYHKKGEDYEIFWPEKTDFIRMAALHDAIVVPFGAIGVADSFDMVLDRDDILASPLLRDRATKSLDSIPQARAGGTEQFIAPISVPKLSGPGRQYFLFGQPYDTRELSMRNKKECKAAYQDIRDRVRSCISVLKDVRKGDRFSDFVPRQLYERTTNRQAPVDLSCLF